MENIALDIILSILIILAILIIAIGIYGMYNICIFGDDTGIVIKKEYIPYRCRYNPTLKKSVKEFEIYEITLQKEVKGKIRRKIIEVTEEEYDNIQINDYYGK